MRLLYAALLLAVSTPSAFAQRAPVLVVPGKPGVPVFINGIDASWAVVEGEFGLDRPGQVTPTVISRPYVIAVPSYVPPYYPALGRRPGYGRYEVVPPPDRILPPPAPTYFRNWSSQSAPGRVTEYAPGKMPEITVEPYVGRRFGARWPKRKQP